MPGPAFPPVAGGRRSEPLSPPQPGWAPVAHTCNTHSSAPGLPAPLPLDSSLLAWVTSAFGFSAAHLGPRHPSGQRNFLNDESYLLPLSHLNPSVASQYRQEKDSTLGWAYVPFGVWGPQTSQSPFEPLPPYTSLSGQPEPFAVS